LTPKKTHKTGAAMTDRRDAIAAELERNLTETVSLFQSLKPDEFLGFECSQGDRGEAACAASSHSGIRPGF
jgi:hypothetical protein